MRQRVVGRGGGGRGVWVHNRSVILSDEGRLVGRARGTGLCLVQFGGVCMANGTVADEVVDGIINFEGEAGE